MGGLGMTELLLIGGIALLFFGPSRLPSLGQALGKTISNFKRGLRDINSEETDRRQISSSSEQSQILNRERG